MKLFKGGYGKYVDFVAAKNTEEAVKKLREIRYLKGLPVNAEEVTIPGFVIDVKPEKKSNDDK
jgi:hypothetical protein